MRILADENIPLIHEFFDGLGEVETVAPRALSREHTAQADLLVVRSVVPIGRDLLEGTPVRFVGSCTAGVDHLDGAALDDLGIRWTGAPGCNANSVVDYVFSALAALDLDPRRKTVGVIGCGNVGSRLVRRLQKLDVECLAYDPLIEDPALPLSDLASMLEADIICVHAPLTTTGPQPSRHLLSGQELDALKAGATLISAGRGGVVDNRALLERLQRGRELQTVLDVWESEPDIDRELFSRAEFGTPHIAGHSYDGKARGTEIIYQKASGFLGDQPMRSFAELDPYPQPEPIRLSAESEWSALRQAILSAYDLREDHHRFAKALAESPAPGLAFDQQRKHYPIRREFGNFRVEAAQLSAPLEAALRAIGFRG